MKRLIRFTALTAGVLSAAVLTAVCITDMNLPDSYNLTKGEEFVLEDKEYLSASPVIQAPGFSDYAPIAPAASQSSQSRKIIKLFGIFPVKEVKVTSVEPEKVISGGQSFGVKLYAHGVMVIGFSDVTSENYCGSPAYDAGIRRGDMIFTLDGQDISSNEDISEIISRSNGKGIVAEFSRSGKKDTLSFTPVKTAEGFKAGMWVRDSTAGIGTVTYYDPQTRVFGGLGHGITDIDTGELYEISSGEVVGSWISSVVKGESGIPGELRGSLMENKSLGSLFANTVAGVFGRINSIPDGDIVDVAMKQEVRRGKAYILSTISGDTVEKYEIEIISVNYDSSVLTKNMVIHVTDKRLLSSTGGIVQGMSGSPIFQGGKLVGAVTHVFVGDPTGGYAIFAENMVGISEKILDAA